VAKPRACAAHSRGAVRRCPSASGRRRSGALFGARAGALDRRLGCGRRHPQHRLPSAVLSTLRSAQAAAVLAHVPAPVTTLISSPESGVFDVASVCFSLRRGRVIFSGVFDVVDVADADPEVHGSGLALARRRAVRTEPVTGRERGTAQTGRASR
jgi:hypothetical protein